MKFLLDENIGKSVAWFLIQLGHAAVRVKKIYPGLEDSQVLKLSIEKEAILLTLDKDYGELIFKEGKLHTGVIFLRLDNQASPNLIKALSWLFSTYAEAQIKNNFTVITEKLGKFKARFSR